MTSIKGQLAQEALKNFDIDTPTKKIARSLFHNYPELFATVEDARNIVRYYRGNKGVKDRTYIKDNQFVRENDKAGYVTKLPASRVDEWTPYIIRGNYRVLILCDIHIPYHDTEALEAALAFGDDYDPDIIILNGDIFDCYTISRFQKNPRKRDLKHELISGRLFLRHLRSRYPDAKIIFKIGNHENRWKYFLWNQADVLWNIHDTSFRNVFRLKRYKTILVDDDRIIMLGNLPILHGHEFSRGLTNPVNPARGIFLKGIASCLVGHWHRTSDHTEESLTGKTIVTRSVGCLCFLHPEYSRINRWNHGFSTIELNENGDYEVSNYRISKGKVFR